VLRDIRRHQVRRRKNNRIRPIPVLSHPFFTTSLRQKGLHRYIIRVQRRLCPQAASLIEEKTFSILDFVEPGNIHQDIY
jgi:hypothetical protein